MLRNYVLHCEYQLWQQCRPACLLQEASSFNESPTRKSRNNFCSPLAMCSLELRRWFYASLIMQSTLVKPVSEAPSSDDGKVPVAAPATAAPRWIRHVALPSTATSTTSSQRLTSTSRGSHSDDRRTCRRHDALHYVTIGFFLSVSRVNMIT